MPHFSISALQWREQADKGRRKHDGNVIAAQLATRTAAPFARILVGSIPTAQGADARALALELARLCDARLELVSVIEARWLDDLGEQSGPAAIQHEEHEQAAAALTQAVEQLSQPIGADRVEQRLEVSRSAARGLHEAAVAERPDLIVVGSSHRGPLGRVLLGSVGERLLSGAPCAVAVAPRGYASRPPKPLERILVAFDGSPEARLALDTAQTLAQRAATQLSVVSVVVPSSPGVAVAEATQLSGLDVVVPAGDIERLGTIQLAEALKRQQEAASATLEAAIAELHAAIAPEVLTGPDAATTIIDIARDRADLLVLGSRSYGPLRRTLLGSVSARVMRQAPCPVLVMPRAGAPRRLQANPSDVNGPR